jgi:hypothetical protein
MHFSVAAAVAALLAAAAVSGSRELVYTLYQCSYYQQVKVSLLPSGGPAAGASEQQGIC